MTSKIKVDNINKVSDDSNIIKKCGTTTTIGSGASNPIVVDGSAITLGRCGGTVALASGATQSGFGRTGTVDWQTGSIKTATFTAANGEGYFANTSGGSFTMNLPAGTAGAIVAVVDYTNTFQTHALTIAANGSQKIGGLTENALLSTEGQSVTLVYVDDTEGWKQVNGTTDNVTGATFICASVSGSCNALSTCGNFKIATFRGPGTFTVNAVASSPVNNDVDFMVVGGGGGAGHFYAGGGGAGGFRESPGTATGSYTVSPLGSPGPGNAPITVTATGFPITVGGGGAGSGGNPSTPSPSCSGSLSSFSTIQSAGGGSGGGGNPGKYNAQPGGSGGGGGNGSGSGGTGNSPPVSPPQGNNGGNSPSPGGSNGGGGGAGAAGVSSAPGPGADGGVGVGTSINPAASGPTAVGTPGPSSPLRYFAGGGGSQGTSTSQAGSVGGGGGDGNPGTANTGGGGGADNGNGGSGIVIIRYRFQ